MQIIMLPADESLLSFSCVARVYVRYLDLALQTFSKGHACLCIRHACWLLPLLYFILCHAEPGEALLYESFFFFNLTLDSCFSTFCLDAKGGAKKSRQTQMAPPVLPPTHNNSHHFIHHSFTSFQESWCITTRNFFKRPCLSFWSNKQHRRCIPLPFS